MLIRYGVTVYSYYRHDYELPDYMYGIYDTHFYYQEQRFLLRVWDYRRYVGRIELHM